MGAIDPGPGTTSPGSGDTLAVPDFVGDIDLGPGAPLLESGVRPHLTGDCDILQMRDFLCAIGPEHEETSPESGDILAVPDVVSNLFGSRS